MTRSARDRLIWAAKIIAVLAALNVFCTVSERNDFKLGVLLFGGAYTVLIGYAAFRFFRFLFVEGGRA